MSHKILAVFAATLLSVVAFANDNDMGARGDAKFKAMDGNRDARLSQNEVLGDQQLAQHFTALDRDSDGYLNKREYSAHLKDDNQNKQGRQY
jgi:hypothetical protein